MPPEERPVDGRTINVRMEVDRVEIVEDGPKGVVQVWGYVGDYEVCLWIRRSDPRVKKLLNEAKT